MVKTDTALLLLSGGLDSTLCLHQRVEAGLPTRTHHVRLTNHEGRQDLEDRAVESILDWFGASIEHTRSEVDWGTLRWIPADLYLWAYWAAAILSSPREKHIDTLIIPRHQDAFRTAAAAEHSDRVYTETIERMAGRTVRLEYPILEMRKTDIVEALPESLRKLCWFCRKPRHGRPCGTCMTCKQVLGG